MTSSGKQTLISPYNKGHKYIMLYTSHRSRFELTTSVVIATDYIGSCKFNYHAIMTMTGPTSQTD